MGRFSFVVPLPEALQREREGFLVAQAGLDWSYLEVGGLDVWR